MTSKKLQKSRIIQKAVAFLLLVVFTISVTPGHLFHDALSSHADEQVCRDEDKSVPHFHKPTFHCSFNELVVSTPFLGDVHQPEIKRPAFVVSYALYFPPSPLTTHFRYTESRGPPMI